MKTIAIVIAGLGLAGCELVFSVDTGSAPDAGETDVDADDVDAALPDDAAPLRCPAGESEVAVATDAIADTMLVASNPTQNFGGTRVINVGADLRSRAVLRFPIDPAMGEPIELRLRLRYAVAQDDCAPGCGTCESIERAGQLTAYAMIAGWIEDEATWNLRGIGMPWDGPGADVANGDHSAIAITAPHAAASDTDLVWDATAAAEAWTWRVGSSLAFLVVPQGAPGAGTVMITTTTEGVATSCVAADVPATLFATYCE
jgi:hypothetical protein